MSNDEEERKKDYKYLLYGQPVQALPKFYVSKY